MLAGRTPLEHRSPAISAPDPALLVRVEDLAPFLSSWQTIGGCGAGAGSGSAAGLKWIGRNATGGLFNVQEQASYTDLGSKQYPERNFFFNTLISADVGEKFNFGINVPLIYKYLNDPTHVGGVGSQAIDYSNGGLGDISVLATRKLGRINALTLTGIVGLPTGTSKLTYTPPGAPYPTYLTQSQQLGFGKPTYTGILDQTLDQVWGVIVVGGAAAWRGGDNGIAYRAPTASAYAYAGYFWGPFVPSFGLALSGFKGHDRDLSSVQNSPIASLAANLSLEWSTDWLAVLLAASFPYKYDATTRDDSGLPRSPWGFMPWTLAVGLATSPF